MHRCTTYRVYAPQPSAIMVPFHPSPRTSRTTSAPRESRIKNSTLPVLGSKNVHIQTFLPPRLMDVSSMCSMPARLMCPIMTPAGGIRRPQNLLRILLTVPDDIRMHARCASLSALSLFVRRHR